jgi:hypothetical protein
VAGKIESHQRPTLVDQGLSKRLVSAAVITKTMNGDHDTPRVLIADPQPRMQPSAASRQQSLLTHWIPPK